MDRSDPVVQGLLEAAKAAAANAYAPYSGFRVGAAVLTQSGEVFAGCNVENSSYSLTVCAERNAIFQGVAAGHRRMIAVAIFVPEGDPAPPCGACRQVMSELAPEAQIFSFSKAGNCEEWSVAELQPHPFLLDRNSGA